ncbi:MAG: chorismate mutase [Anaerolineales bacterium]|jgi:chorismate mutase
MAVRGVRGATVAEKDDPEKILFATRKLLNAILTENPDMIIEDIASVLFTSTDDLNSVYPAKAAREMGWNQVPLISASEIPVPGGLAGCIRVLIHWNTDKTQSEIRHVYLGAAASLRPDLSGKS